jgi:hypothetical protein
MTATLDLWALLTPAEQEEARRLLPLAGELSTARPMPDTAYARNPVGWAVDVLGIPEHTIRWSLLEEYATHQWDGTPDPLARMAEELAAGHDVGVESGTGTGKTYTVGWLVLWFVACHKPSLVVTTAPKEDQLTLQLWKEVGQHWQAFTRAYPSAATVKLRVRMDPTSEDADAWAIIGYACGVEADQESATRAQGFHSEHMLLVTEETPGVPAPVMTAFKNTSVGEHNLRLSVGNPDSQHDSLHVFCTSSGVVHIRISSYDHPNVVTGREVIPGATTRRKIRELEEDYGRDSDMFASRVRGISPKQASDSVIQWAWLEAAAARYKAAERAGQIGGAVALGVDVAQSERGDKASVAEWRGHRLTEVKAAQCPNATILGRDVFARMRRDGVQPRHVGVDPVGVGAATVNALDELTPPAMHTRVQHLNGGLAPMAVQRADEGGRADWAMDANNFANLRAQMWWQLREDLRRGRVDLAYDEDLFRELTTPKSVVKNGKTYVEAKLEIRKRTGGKSPDRADAAVYGNWVRPRAALPPAPPARTSEDQHPGFTSTGGRVTRADHARPQSPARPGPVRPVPPGNPFGGRRGALPRCCRGAPSRST